MFFKEHGASIMSSFVGRPVELLRGYTFGIYLVHIFVLAGVRAVFQNTLSLSPTSLLYLLAGIPTVILVSVAIVALLKRIPLLRHIVP